MLAAYNDDIHADFWAGKERIKKIPFYSIKLKVLVAKIVQYVSCAFWQAKPKSRGWFSFLG